MNPDLEEMIPSGKWETYSEFRKSVEDYDREAPKLSDTEDRVILTDRGRSVSVDSIDALLHSVDSVLGDYSRLYVGEPITTKVSDTVSRTSTGVSAGPGKIHCGDASIGIEVDDTDGKEMIFNSDDVREIQKMSRDWGIIKEGQSVVNPEVFAGIPDAIIGRTIEAVKKAIEAVGVSDLKEMAVKTAILETVEKFAK